MHDPASGPVAGAHDDSLLQVGHGVCGDLHRGRSVADIRAEVSGLSQDRFPPQYLEPIIRNASLKLCPQFRDKVARELDARSSA